jgi:hypothetical protein
MIEGDKLAGFMRDFKKFIAQRGIADCGVSDGTVWQFRYDRVVVATERIFLRKLQYIHRNPVRAGLCQREDEWVWSSAGAYLRDECGPVPVWKEWQF